MEFSRKEKGDLPIIAICYDFDKTLSKTDMQAQGFIQKECLYDDVKKFWEETNKIAQENEMDQNLVWMLKMINNSRGRSYVTKMRLYAYGKNVELFPGVDTWFDRIKEYGEEKGVIIEHYIISSGLKEMIEGTIVGEKFEKIYASSFYYDESGVAIWPSQVINFTNKTQFLFRIEKGVLNINDPAINEVFKPEDIRIPFRNMIYIGDSDTDVPCMKLINSRGGYSIGVYDPKTKDKNKVYKMMCDNRIKYFSPADYSKDSSLEKLVKKIIDKTCANELLENEYSICKNEVEKATKNSTKDDIERSNLLVKLDNSTSFANTHTVIAEMKNMEWNKDEDLRVLFRISNSNNQIKYILNDYDVRNFLYPLLEKKLVSKDAKEIYEIYTKEKKTKY